ncbi:MAG: DDE-type integrase/transposase/recombinase [Candidatus Omnitrophica bacterium]|nr:DDE-type integrase/transposase/recombinase [Candidatus Omnitrophota bacterium]
MHGPYVKEGARKQKSYLIGIIDDHSRLIVHAEFYLSEGLSNLRVALKEAFLRRGLPMTLYIDNGACYKSVHLEQITASLGISVKHTPPYTPQGRGKIERWFKYVRDNFMPMFKGGNLNELNLCFEKWVEEYNNRKHSSTNETPIERYKRNMQCVRPSPKDIMSYFRRVDKRLVKKDRTFRLNGNTYEAPVGLIDRKVEVKYDECDASKVEIYFDGMSFGTASMVDAHINAKLGRNWLTPHRNVISKEPEINPNQKIQSGELKFTTNTDNEEVFK